MAIIGTDQEDDQKPTTSASPNARATLQGVGNNPSVGGGSGFAGGTGTGSGQGATTSVAPGVPGASAGNPGGYTNLSQYLSANQGSGAATGQAAENVVQQSADATAQAQNAYNTSGSNDIAAATSGLGVNQDVLGKINAGAATVDPNQLKKITEGGNSTTGKYTGPAAVTAAYGGPTPEKVIYSGPDVGSFTGQTAANQTAAQSAQGVLSGKVADAQRGQEGVAALLKDAYAQPSYNAGENNLDAFLANGTTGGQAALGQAGALGTAASTNYANILDTLKGKAAAGRGMADATNSAYSGAVTNAQNSSAAAQKAYNDAIAAATEKAKAYVAPPVAPVGTGPGGGGGGGGKGPLSGEDNATKAGDFGSHPVDTTVTAVKQAAADTKNAVQTFGGQISSAAKDAGKTLATAVKDPSTIPGALKTGVKTFVNAVTKEPAPIKKAIDSIPVANNVAPKVQQELAKVGAKIKGIHFAHGGEVPTYSKILEMLKEKKK